VVSTIALPTLSRFIGRQSAAEERSAARLRFRAIRLLNIQLDGPPVSPHTWMYVSEPGYLMARIQEPIHRSPQMAPAGATSLMLEIPCQMGDAVWSAPEGEIYERCLSDLARLGIHGLRPRTRGYFSSYVPEGYPIYHLDYADDRRRLLAHVDGIPGLISCGRQGGFRYIFMDTAMEMGIAAARTALKRRSATPIADLGLGSRGLLEAQALTA
jgi:protoporphyrinogen oxidase